MPETLYLIDGYAQIFRAYYAIRGGLRSAMTGEPTNAVFGFTGMLLKLFSQFDPHYVVVAIDAPGRTFRDDLYGQYEEIRMAVSGGVAPGEIVLPGLPGDVTTTPVRIPPEEQYKGTRQATPDDLRSQISRIFEVVEGFNIPLIGEKGLEADDVIATIVQRILDNPEYNDIHIRIVSKDKDLEQLLGARVSMFDIHTDTLIDVPALKANKGVAPDQVVDMLALMGDAVDNIPGVEGIGPKTASQLVQQFGSLDGILANLDQIKGKRRESLEKARFMLPLSRVMVTLRRDGRFPFSLDAARISPIALPHLLPLFRQLGFTRYQDDLRKLAEREEVVVTSAIVEEDLPQEEESDRSDGGETHAADPKTDRMVETAASGDYRAITTRTQLEELIGLLHDQPMVSVDTETTGLGRDAVVCGISFSWESGKGVYVPLLSPEPTRHLDPETALKLLKPLLEDERVPKCGHNLKFDALALLRSGIHLRGVVFDSMLASILLDPARPAHKLDTLALAHLNHQMIPISDLIGREGGPATMNEVALDEVVPYAVEDTDIALRLYHVLWPEIEKRGMGHLLRDIEAPLSAVIAEMEHNGILCDPEMLRQQGVELGRRAEDLRREICALAGCDFHVESTSQLADVLFDRLGFPSGKKTKTGRSTDISVLEKLAGQEDRNDPKTSVPRLVIEYRQLTKLISTYLGNLRAAVSPVDGRIRSSFHQLLTATGRLASHGPNLQNIPIRSEAGRQIRKAFVAPPGHVLICADYSQIELRLLAHLSGDPALFEAFDKGEDIHTTVAAQVFGTSMDAVTKDMRARAKTINFGIIYGITPFGLARRIEGLDVAGATALIEQYKKRFPGIQNFLAECVQEAMEKGYVCTITGRCRAIPEVHSSNRNTQNLGERLAINSVVQGSAADLIKAAMVHVQRRIDRESLPLKMLLQIHDELVLECPEANASACAKIVCEEMEAAMELRVPLRADAGIGPDWMSAK